MTTNTRFPGSEADTIRRSLEALVKRLDEVHEDDRYKAVWTLYWSHGGRYTAPTYTEALDAARAALSSPASGYAEGIEAAARVAEAYPALWDEPESGASAIRKLASAEIADRIRSLLTSPVPAGERESIVAWLRSMSTKPNGPSATRAADLTCTILADAIERGDHMHPPTGDHNP